MVAKAQAVLQLENAQVMGELAINLAADPGNLDVSVAACLLPIGGAIETAIVNIEGSVSATVGVFGAVGI